MVGITHPEDKEGIFTPEEKPKNVEATVDIITQGVASKFEILSDTGLSDLPDETVQKMKPKTTILPIEAAIAQEVHTRETEAPFSEINLTIRKRISSL